MILTIDPELREMAVLAMDMVDLAVKAFDQEDISLADKLGEMDDVLDAKCGELIKETSLK